MSKLGNFEACRLQLPEFWLPRLDTSAPGPFPGNERGLCIRRWKSDNLSHVSEHVALFRMSHPLTRPLLVSPESSPPLLFTLVQGRAAVCLCVFSLGNELSRCQLPTCERWGRDAHPPVLRCFQGKRQEAHAPSGPCNQPLECPERRGAGSRGPLHLHIGSSPGLFSVCRQEKEEYIRAKYVDRRFVSPADPGGKPTVTPSQEVKKQGSPENTAASLKGIKAGC